MLDAAHYTRYRRAKIALHIELNPMKTMIKQTRNKSVASYFAAAHLREAHERMCEFSTRSEFTVTNLLARDLDDFTL